MLYLGSALFFSLLVVFVSFNLLSPIIDRFIRILAHKNIFQISSEYSLNDILKLFEDLISILNENRKNNNSTLSEKGIGHISQINKKKWKEVIKWVFLLKNEKLDIREDNDT